ncbi:flagellar hook-length control protein FliK, partial [Paraburkholderia sp. Ac-20342]|uniref:flagellar hook-length control protein FliK n=1 Tax=Paraburkholderia sp. Ac-20342 TaxID=2703889 RepID=UPI00197D3451
GSLTGATAGSNGASWGKPLANGLFGDGKGLGASHAASTGAAATALSDPATAKSAADALTAAASSSAQADNLATARNEADASSAALAALAATQAAANAASTTAAVQSTGNASAAAAAANALAPQVGTSDWEEALSQKVVFLSNAHSQSAELTLNPKDLGPLQVVLQVADNHAHALFVSQHQSVREAVEAALPKLREAMESNGIGLGSASVSDGFARQGGGQQNAGSSGRSGGKSSGGSGGGAIAGGGASDSGEVVAVRQAVGLVDTFV